MTGEISFPLKDRSASSLCHIYILHAGIRTAEAKAYFNKLLFVISRVLIEAFPFGKLLSHQAGSHFRKGIHKAFKTQKEHNK